MTSSCNKLLSITYLSITSIFRTYSVDSSESSSDEGNEDKDVREEVEELTKVLSDLVRENRELEVSSHFLNNFKKNLVKPT